MNIRIKKIHQDAVIPTKGTEFSSGFDLIAISKTISPNYIEYDTGIAMEIPNEYVGLVVPRSSLSNKANGFYLKNSLGIIDPDYRGSIKLRFNGREIYSSNIYEVGDKIGQILFIKNPNVELIEVDELSDTVRNEGGFGSTDTEDGYNSTAWFS